MGRPSDGNGSIKLVGVELEGVWNGRRPVGFTHDGSVEGLYGDHVGEVPSKPMLPSEISRWVLEHYPAESNSSCGMHTHMSFTSKLAYSLLMEHAQAVEQKLLARLSEWGEEKEIRLSHAFWSRLDGRNSFCEKGGYPDAQAMTPGKNRDRYHMLNFCYRLHGTLECRILPMFKKPNLAVSALETVYHVINEMLATLPKLSALDMETELGLLKCHAWKQGYTVSLLASPRVKKEALTYLFPGASSRIAQRSPERGRREPDLAYLLLIKDHVQCPVRTRDGLENLLAEVRDQYWPFTVSLTRRGY